MVKPWFSGGSSSKDQPHIPSSSSLLADWNSYATSRDADGKFGLAIRFDLKASVHSANDNVSDTFIV